MYNSFVVTRVIHFGISTPSTFFVIVYFISFIFTAGKLFYPVYNNEGCYPYDYDLENVPEEDFIVLVKRGTCPFSIKEYIVEALGASGLIVYQNMNSPPTVMTGLAGTTLFTIHTIYYSYRAINHSYIVSCNHMEFMV